MLGDSAHDSQLPSSYVGTGESGAQVSCNRSIFLARSLERTGAGLVGVESSESSESGGSRLEEDVSTHSEVA